MAYVTTNGFSQAVGFGSAPSTAVPAGVGSGIHATLACAIDTVAPDFQTADWPTGFTELADITMSENDGQKGAAGEKFDTNGDSGNYAFGDLGNSGDWGCGVVLHSGRHASTPATVNSNATTVFDDTTNYPIFGADIPGITAADGMDMAWIAIPDVQASGVGNGFTAPTDYTIRVSVEQAWTNLCIATKDNQGGGATGTVHGTFTVTSDGTDGGGILVGIPAAAASFVPDEESPPVARPFSAPPRVTVFS